MAGLAIVAILVVQASRCLQILIVHELPSSNLRLNPEEFLSYFFVSLPRLAGYTVAVSWLALALGGRWSKEPGVRGQFGRALGWCWIAMALSSELGVWCFALNY